MNKFYQIRNEKGESFEIMQVNRMYFHKNSGN